MKRYTKQTKAERIRELDRAGFTVKQIAAKVGCTVDYVYVVRWDSKKKAAEPTTPAPSVAPAPKRGRPKGSKNKKPNASTGIKFVPVPLKNEGQIIGYGYGHPPIPAPKLTMRQRFMALFTGRV